MFLYCLRRRYLGRAFSDGIMWQKFRYIHHLLHIFHKIVFTLLNKAYMITAPYKSLSYFKDHFKQII